MTKNNDSVLSIQIGDKQLTLKCPSEKATDLKQCAQYVDALVRTALQGKPYTPGGLERTALMTALNIAHDLLLQQRQQETYIAAMSKRVEILQNKIENTLRHTQPDSESEI